MEIDIDDLRSQERRKSFHSILISYPSQDGSNQLVKHTCTTEDISESGLKIVARRPLPLGSVIPIEVNTVKPKEHFKFMGEVKWCLEVDDAPTFFAGIKLIKIVENNYKKWLSVANS